MILFDSLYSRHRTLSSQLEFVGVEFVVVKIVIIILLVMLNSVSAETTPVKSLTIISIHIFITIVN
jgi:hypothetical protein